MVSAALAAELGISRWQCTTGAYMLIDAFSGSILGNRIHL